MHVVMVRAGLFLAASAIAIAAAAAHAGETTSYTYDSFGRLVGTSTTGTVNDGDATSISYDAAGNRTNYSPTSGSGGGGGGGVPPPVPPPNSPPTTVADSLSIPACGTGSVNLILNDSDPESNYPLALVSVTSSAKATATVVSSSTVSVDSTGPTGTSALTYTVQDSLGASSTGILNVTITSGNCQ